MWAKLLLYNLSLALQDFQISATQITLCSNQAFLCLLTSFSPSLQIRLHLQFNTPSATCWFWEDFFALTQLSTVARCTPPTHTIVFNMWYTAASYSHHMSPTIPKSEPQGWLFFSSFPYLLILSSAQCLKH